MYILIYPTYYFYLASYNISLSSTVLQYYRMLMKLSYRCCTIKYTEFVLVQLEDPNTITRTVSSASHLFEQLQ